MISQALRVMRWMTEDGAGKVKMDASDSRQQTHHGARKKHYRLAVLCCAEGMKEDWAHVQHT